MQAEAEMPQLQQKCVNLEFLVAVPQVNEPAATLMNIIFSVMWYFM